MSALEALPRCLIWPLPSFFSPLFASLRLRLFFLTLVPLVVWFT